MIVVKIQGGLGNQLFQYAFAVYLRMHLPFDVALDLAWFTQQQKEGDISFRAPDILRIGNLALQTITTSAVPKTLVARIKKRVFEQAGCRYRYFDRAMLTILEDPEQGFDESWLAIANNSYLDGYFQAPRYADLAQEVLLPWLNRWANGKYLNDLRSREHRTLVSLHVRRGDYLKYQLQFPLCSFDYYRKAINYLRDVYGDLFFWVFTDDSDWVLNNAESLGLGSTFVNMSAELKDPCTELAYMSFCDHHIISNSTFSWWGAWMNTRSDKTVIAPKTWFGIEERSALNQEIVPAGWLRF